MRKLDFSYAKTKAQISAAVTVKLISDFCFNYKMDLYGLMEVIPDTYCIMYQQAFNVIKWRTTVIYVFDLLFLLFMLCIMITFEINKLISILFVHLSSIIPENFKDLILIILEIFEFLELHTYKFGLVYYSKLDKYEYHSIDFHKVQ